MSEHKAQAEVLFLAGGRDLLALSLLIETGRAPHESIGFHAQQACEKFLKTVAVLHGIVFERTHDLIVLFELPQQHNIAVPISSPISSRAKPSSVPKERALASENRGLKPAPSGAYVANR